MKAYAVKLGATVAMVCCIALAGCGEQQKADVSIAAKPMAEQFILAEMLRLLIEEHAGLTVQITKGIGGGTSNIHPALVRGDFDLYPEYTGTAWNFVLKKEDIPDAGALFAELAREYSDQFGLEWVGLYGFNNSFGLVVRRDIAEQYGIATYSDLAPHAGNLIFGAEYDFYEREDGYDALCAAYGLGFAQRVDLDIGLKYQALSDGRIQVMNVGTTDGQLAASDSVLLRDDKGFYRTYYCGTVVRADTLKKYPQLRPALARMDRLLTEEDMARLNHQVEVEGRAEEAVAAEFLRAKGLLPGE